MTLLYICALIRSLNTFARLYGSVYSLLLCSHYVVFADNPEFTGRCFRDCLLVTGRMLTELVNVSDAASGLRLLYATMRVYKASLYYVRM